MSVGAFLRVGVIYDPFMATDCALDPRCPLRGAAVDATLIVCRYLNLTCLFRWASDRNDYGRLIGQNNWTGMIGDVYENRFDTAIPYFFPTFEREKFLDFSTPYFAVEQVFVTRMPRQNALPDLDFTVIFAFEWLVWLSILFSCFAVGVLISIFENRDDDKIEIETTKTSRPQIFFNTTFKALKYVSGHGDRFRVYNRSGSNFLFTWWGLLSLALSGTYTGAMVCKRIASKTELPFTDFGTFVPCVETGRCRLIISSRQDYLYDRLNSSKSDESNRLRRAFSIYPPLIVGDDQELWTKILNDTDSYWTTIDTKQYFYANTDYNAFCRYYVVKAPFADMAAFPLKKRSPLRRRFDAAARIFRDNGLSTGLSKKYQKTADKCQLALSEKRQQASRSEVDRIVPFYSIRSSGILYAVGIFASTTTLMAEIWKKYNRKKTKAQWRRLSLQKKIIKFFRWKNVEAKVE